MDTNNNNINKKHTNLRLLFPVIVLVVVLVGYFVYQGFFASPEIDPNSNSNSYINNTRLGKNVDILNKENFIFNTNINNNVLSNIKDFSQIINPSNRTGRNNPFLP